MPPAPCQPGAAACKSLRLFRSEAPHWVPSCPRCQSSGSLQFKHFAHHPDAWWAALLDWWGRCRLLGLASFRLNAPLLTSTSRGALECPASAMLKRSAATGLLGHGFPMRATWNVVASRFGLMKSFGPGITLVCSRRLCRSVGFCRVGIRGCASIVRPPPVVPSCWVFPSLLGPRLKPNVRPTSRFLSRSSSK